jgi:hypothetical protein
MSNNRILLYQTILPIVMLILVSLMVIFIPQGCISNRHSVPVVINSELCDWPVAHCINSSGIDSGCNNLNVKYSEDGFLVVKAKELTAGTCIFDKDWRLIGVVVSKDKQNVIIADIDKIKQMVK